MTASRLTVEARLTIGGGGGISEVLTLFELEVASKGCLDAGLFETGRLAATEGVAESLL